MFLFVYGTLRHEFHGEMANRLAAESEWIGRAIVENAELYRIGGDQFDYPAMLVHQNGIDAPSKGGAVYGDIFRLLNPSETLEWLDEYEECGPKYAQPNEYLRVEIRAKLIGEKKEIGAFAYVWNLPIQNGNGEFVGPVMGRIGNGDWMEEEKKEGK